MILRLLLVFSAFSLVSTSVSIDKLKYQPQYWTKDEILALHKNLTEEPVFKVQHQLVYIDTENPNGQALALKRANHLTHISYLWLTVEPVYDDEYKDDRKIISVKIVGLDNIKHKYVTQMRMANWNIKIVPRLQFAVLPRGELVGFLENEKLIQDIVLDIVEFCEDNSFDGVVLDMFKMVENAILGKHTDLVLETWKQLGEGIRSYDILAILSMKTPIDVVHNQHEIIHHSRLTTKQAQSLISWFDFVIIWPNIKRQKRNFMNDLNLERNILEFGDDTSKVLIGMSFTGVECPLTKNQRGTCDNYWKDSDFERFMDVLSSDDMVLSFNAETMEHELKSRYDDVFMVFPSLTQLEYQLHTITRWKDVGVAIAGYGQGLDFFTDVV